MGIFDQCKRIRKKYGRESIWETISVLFGIFHILDACSSFVVWLKSSLKEYTLKGPLWSNAMGLSLLLLLATVTAAVLLLYGIYMMSPCMYVTYMTLFGSTCIVTASLVTAMIYAIGESALLRALLIRIPFHLLGLITAYIALKRLKQRILSERPTYRKFSLHINELQAIEEYPAIPMFTRSFSEVRPSSNYPRVIREHRSYSIA